VLELAGAIGILLPQTRVLAGYCLMAFMLAVLPVHLHMALHSELYSDIPEWGLQLRIGLQFVFIAFVWWAIKPERSHTNSASTSYQ